MGIPIGWNIRRDEAKAKDVLRADLTGRSPIRRRARSDRSPTSPNAFDVDFVISNSRYGQHLEPVSRPSHAHTRLAPPPVPEVSRPNHHGSDVPRNPPTLHRDESSLSRAPVYVGAHQMRMGPMSFDGERPLPALTPGFAPAVAAHPLAAEALREASRAFGRVGRDRSYHRRDRDPRLTRSRSPRADHSAARNDHADTAEDGHESSESNAVGFPPLRRMGRRTIADGPLPASSLRESWSPVSTLDGLGDRERSISPFDEQMPPWDTFLTTVVPDPLGPTAESSFASAAAAASFSNSNPSSRAGSANSATSSQTHITVPSRRHSPHPNEQFMRACDTSEDDTASDTEEEDIDVHGSIRRRNGAEATRNRLRLSDQALHRRRMRPSYFSHEPPMRDPERYSRRVLERTRHASAYVHNHYNQYNANSSHDTEVGTERPRIGDPSESSFAFLIDEPPSADPPLDQELRDARSLLERLSRREDISDDFWASVGLTRSFADPVERFQERERQ